MPVTLAQYQSLVHDVTVRLGGIRGNVDPILEVPDGTTPRVNALDDLVKTLIETSNAELTRDLGGLAAIPFRYIPDGCYARAHIMAEILGDHGIDNAKMFVLGSLSAANADFPRGVSWGYHVAPLVIVDDQGQPGLRIVDPAVASAPLDPVEWITTIDPSKRAVEIRCRPRSAYFPKGTPATFDQNLGAARTILAKYAQRLPIAALARAARLAAGPIDDGAPAPVPFLHEHEGIPDEIDGAAMTLMFQDSAMLYRIASPGQLAALQSAREAQRTVSVEADPETGTIASLR
jgi:hypothetical protein